MTSALCFKIPGRINISGATHELVKDFFDCEFRGKVAAKHKGEIDGYFVNGIRSELSVDAEGRIPNEGFFQLYSTLERKPPAHVNDLKGELLEERSGKR